MTTPKKFYECDICGHIHPWSWDGDCRDDDNRFTFDILEAMGASGEPYVLYTMEDRVAADDIEEG